jgi:hypothetical protein
MAAKHFSGAADIEVEQARVIDPPAPYVGVGRQPDKILAGEFRGRSENGTVGEVAIATGA